MAELKSKIKEYSGSFKEAFKQASKEGAKKFKWKGTYYTTDKLEDKSSPSHSSVTKGNAKEKYGKSNGTVSNRYVVRNHGKNGFSVYDNEVGRYIGSLHKDKQSAVNYLNSDKFKEDAGELEITTARTKLNRNTSGFLPVDENKNFLDREGNTRLYQERGTGRYLVTDNYGNIVGYSFDPAAATADANWGGWKAYTGSKEDLAAAGAGKLRDEANRNEDALKTRQAKERMTDDWERLMDGIRRMQGGFNTVQGMLNMPNNIITGAARAAISDDYSWDDYANSFTIDGLWRGNASVGLGDVLELDNPYARFGANLINPMSVLGTVMKSSTPTYKVKGTEGQPIIVKSQSTGAARSNFRRGYRPNEGMGTNQRGQTLYGGKHLAGSNVGPVETTKIPTQRYYLDKTPGEFNMTPFNAAFRYDPKTTYVYSGETPTADFYYSGEGNPNTYAYGRITTGEAVPGTSGENWTGGQSGNKLTVVNTKGHGVPSFGGTVVGSAGDNFTNMYMPVGYKKGGKAKLISRKSCRK